METKIVNRTQENRVLSATENCIPHSKQSTMVTEILLPDKQSKVTPPPSLTEKSPKDGVNSICVAGNLKTTENILSPTKLKTSIFPMKIKRKRCRRKPKSNTRPYKKSNWKFQRPRYQKNGGGIVISDDPLCCLDHNGGMRPKLVRSGSIVPYNTNDFLMEEHMAEVSGVRLTPSGRTRDSSFSVDSEENYFFSLPEDEEEFLTKEFANVYERARIERLEAMTKQQLIEECLQLEHRYADGSPQQMLGSSNEFINKIRILEERIRDLNSENLDLRRKMDRRCGPGAISQQERMCTSSEDSESDSSSSSSSSCSSDYSRASRRSSISDDELRDARNSVMQMESDDAAGGLCEATQVEMNNQQEIVCNGFGTLSPTATVEASASAAAAVTTSPSSINENIQSPSAQQIVVNSND